MFSIFFLFLGLAFFASIKCDHQKKVIICEFKKDNIECPSNHVIHIKDAFYGRRNKEHCSTKGANKNIHCTSNTNALELVRQRCENKSSCKLHAENKIFGDPCKGTYKYLEVDYTCVAESKKDKKNKNEGATESPKLDEPKHTEKSPEKIMEPPKEHAEKPPEKISELPNEPVGKLPDKIADEPVGKLPDKIADPAEEPEVPKGPYVRPRTIINIFPALKIKKPAPKIKFMNAELESSTSKQSFFEDTIFPRSFAMPDPASLLGNGRHLKGPRQMFVM